MAVKLSRDCAAENFAAENIAENFAEVECRRRTRAGGARADNRAAWRTADCALAG